MKLQCQVQVVNRLHVSSNTRSSRKYVKSTLAICQETKNTKEYFVILFTSSNRSGARYRGKRLLHMFTKCIDEGKATLRFEEPPHDLNIKSEPIQLKLYIKMLKHCITGLRDLQLACLTSVCVASIPDTATKLVIRDRNKFPSQGFSRTLESLYMSNLQLCNFRRDILLLRHLTLLDMSNNEIKSLPPEFGRMPSLAELHLANNHLGIHGVVDWRWLLGPQIIRTLKLLDVSGNRLLQLPNAIWKLQKLITLKLSNNTLAKLPATLGRISTLRYLTVSQNNLVTLPCSLMHIHLEYLDISINKFHLEKPAPTYLHENPWNIYVGSLVHLASKALLKQKVYYDSSIIPHTLVQFLDDAHMCVCGAPVVNDGFFVNKNYSLKSYIRAIMFDKLNTNSVEFECHFCSRTCYNKAIATTGGAIRLRGPN